MLEDSSVPSPMSGAQPPHSMGTIDPTLSHQQNSTSDQNHQEEMAVSTQEYRMQDRDVSYFTKEHPRTGWKVPSAHSPIHPRFLKTPRRMTSPDLWVLQHDGSISTQYSKNSTGTVGTTDARYIWIPIRSRSPVEETYKRLRALSGTEFRGGSNPGPSSVQNQRNKFPENWNASNGSSSAESRNNVTDGIALRRKTTTTASSNDYGFPDGSNLDVTASMGLNTLNSAPPASILDRYERPVNDNHKVSVEDNYEDSLDDSTITLDDFIDNPDASTPLSSPHPTPQFANSTYRPEPIHVERLEELFDDDAPHEVDYQVRAFTGEELDNPIIVGDLLPTRTSCKRIHEEAETQYPLRAPAIRPMHKFRRASDGHNNEEAKRQRKEQGIAEYPERVSPTRVEDGVYDPVTDRPRKLRSIDNDPKEQARWKRLRGEDVEDEAENEVEEEEEEE